MASTPNYAAVTIDVAQIDDHRQPAFEVDAGIGRHWIDADEQHAIRGRVDELQELATGSHRIAPPGPKEDRH